MARSEPTVPSYAASPHPVRADLAQAHQRAWARIARPGTWWTGAERVAIAAETRNAMSCRLCRARKDALSPYTVEGHHDHLGALPAPVVELIHRVRTDPGRLTRRWYDTVRAGTEDTRYVETVGVLASVVAVDTFARGAGLDPWPLPTPEPGAPTRKRPRGAKQGPAWVPWLAPEDVTEDEAHLYSNYRPAHIRRAMSLVPEEVRGFFDVVEAQYLPGAVMRDFANEYRAITHAQIELIAGRVSALNGCEY